MAVIPLKQVFGPSGCGWHRYCGQTLLNTEYWWGRAPYLRSCSANCSHISSTMVTFVSDSCFEFVNLLRHFFVKLPLAALQPFFKRLLILLQTCVLLLLQLLYKLLDVLTHQRIQPLLFTSGKNSRYFHTLGYETIFLQKSNFFHTQKVLFHTFENYFIPSKKWKLFSYPFTKISYLENFFHTLIQKFHTLSRYFSYPQKTISYHNL